VKYHSDTGATEEYNGSTWTTSNSLNTARHLLGGAGTQTAGLAFGGQGPKLQLQQKNMMELLGQHQTFKYSKIIFSRGWNSNCCFSFWWY
jgi:hypothetical protein